MADKARSGSADPGRADTSMIGVDPGEGTVSRYKTSTRPTGRKRAHTAGTGARGSGAAAPAVPAATGPIDPAALPVRPGEDPWTDEEVAELRQELQAEVARLRDEIHSAELAISGLMRDSGDGAGDDQVDAGTKNISREHELALTNNARDMLTQTERALARLEGANFGLCESCGSPIGKARLQAFPRATLCVQCKQKTERR